jgi:hypothetical protein
MNLASLVKPQEVIASIGALCYKGSFLITNKMTSNFSCDSVRASEYYKWLHELSMFLDPIYAVTDLKCKKLKLP